MRIQIHMLAPGEGEPALQHVQRAQDALLHDHVDVRVWSPEHGKFGLGYETNSLPVAQAFLVRANAQLAEV